MKVKLPTPKYLRSLFRYDSDTGQIFWLDRPREHFATDAVWNAWNKRYSKTEAGHVDAYGYRRIGIRGRNYEAHRVAWAIYNGRWPRQEIDHKNGERDDNRIANLRDVTRQVNILNTRAPTKNKCGVTGVWFHQPTGKYRAKIRFNRNCIHLGCFDTLTDASSARKAAERKYGFTGRHGVVK